MSETTVGKMIENNVGCVLCHSAFGKCECWAKCEKCGWSYEKGTACDSPKCTGVDRLPRATHYGKIRL